MFLFFLLIYMIAICVLMLTYLIGPGKSNFDQVSYSRACALCETKLGIGRAVMFMPYALEN